MKFKIRAEFEAKKEKEEEGIHKILPLYGKDDKGETVFALDRRETKDFTLYFKMEQNEVFESVKPYRINAVVEDDSPQYE